TCSLGKLDLHMFSYSNALLLSLRLLRPAWSLLFPYTTLFRSLDAGGARRPPSGDHGGPGPRRAPAGAAAAVQGDCGVKGAAGGGKPDGLHKGGQARNTASTAGAADAGFPDPSPSWAAGSAGNRGRPEGEPSPPMAAGPNSGRQRGPGGS